MTRPSPVTYSGFLARGASVARGAAVARGAYGAFLLCAPGAALAACGAGPASTGVRSVARLLGARHLIQAAVTARMPGPAVLTAGSGVDVAHAASMLALAAADRPLRRAGLLDGLVAATLAVAGTVAARTAVPRQPPGRRKPPVPRQPPGRRELLATPD